MRVKWNRNLDGIRPLITVPETDVISNCKPEVAESQENKNSFTDLNDNTTSEVVNNESDNTIDTLEVRSCESPCPSSASISSKRSDKSKARISSLFGLFKVKDKVMNDNNSEDCVSNISELSNNTIPSLIAHSMSNRKSSYGSRDLVVFNNEKFAFEADTRRRRRANSLLAKGSMRRSWQQLNGTNKLPISSGYIITKDRIPNHYIDFSHSPLLSMSGKASEPELLITSRSSENRTKSDFLPEVKTNFENTIKAEENINIKTETNITGSETNPIRDSELRDNCDEVLNNTVFVMQTDVQTVKRQTNCISPSDLNIKNSCGCDGVDSKVQSVVNSLDSKQNLLNDSKIIFDPKNNYKNTKSQQKLTSDKTETNFVCNSGSKTVLQRNRICVNQTNAVLDSSFSANIEPISIKIDETIETTQQLSIDQIDGNPVLDKQNENDLSLKSICNNKESDIDLNLASIESYDEPIAQSPVPSITASTGDIVKVKVTKNQLPESEVVCFSSQIVSSPSTVSTTNINNKCNNDGAVVLTFINDEPMTREVLDNEYLKSDVSVKPTPIQGILRVRGKENNSYDNSSNGTEHNAKNQKKVHFADNCLHNSRNSSRSRIVKPRHYGSALGVVASVNDKKTANRRPTQTNTTGSTLTQKRITNTKTNTSNANNNTKRGVRSMQLIDDKQQIQSLTQLCESKTKQLKTLGLDHNYMRLAFDSLSLVIHHLMEQFEPFENPKLKQALKNANKRCEQLKDNLDAKDVELNDMKIIFEEQINQLMKERERNYSDLNQAKVSHESNVKKLKEMHSWEVKGLEEKHRKDLELSQHNCNQLLNEIEDKNCELNKTKQSRDALEIRVNQMEETIMNDKDKKFKYLTEKTKQLELEVESLKVVMDMKNEKIHNLERKMIETQEKINELPFAKETIRSLQQQIETLQITLDRKIHQFNQLTREHEDLKSEYEREMREKRRLSMKNEELAFHLSESFNESTTSGHNNCTNFDSNHIRFRSPALNIDETPIKTNRSISMNTASNRKNHSKVSRSVSISTSTSSVSIRGTPTVYCPSSGSYNNENHFLPNNITDEVFDSGIAPQCILDSGFEEIQGLNSLPK